jgi:uncharacterized protein involved in outer membrane biogenesis
MSKREDAEMKRVMKVVVGVVVVVIVLLVVLTLAAGRIATGTINTAGPKILGVPVSVQSVQVGLLRGHFGLNGLVIGNPEGFKTPEAVRLGKVDVRVKMASLFSDVLIIDRVHVVGPEITYEVGLKGTNIGAIQDKVASPKMGKEEPKAAEKPAKKVQIGDFLIEGGKIHLSTVGMAGHEVTVPLPTIHLTDIGKDSGGASPKEVIAKIVGAVGSTVGGAATGIGKGVEAIGKGAVDAGKAVGEGAKDAGKAVGKGATKALEGVEGLFKK